MTRPSPPAKPSRRPRSAAHSAVAAELVSSNGRRAVFFDRDGTLNEEVGHLSDPHQFLVYPFAARAVRMVNEAGLLAIVVTNQSGVGRGFFAESLVRRVHRQLTRRIAAGGGRLDAIFYCPHHPEASVERYRVVCACRKPAPGLVEAAAKQFGIELSKSFVVGDRFVDIRLAHRVSARSVLVLTGVGRAELEEEQSNGTEQPDHIAENVYEAVRWIVRNL